MSSSLSSASAPQTELSFVTALGLNVYGAYEQTKKGTLYTLQGGARILNSLYNLDRDGLDKTLKFAIEAAKTADIVSKSGNRLNPLIRAFSDLKDLIYATKFLGSFKDLLNPAYNKKGIDVAIDILLGVANVLDTAKYLQKKELVKFSYFSQLATRIGNINVFGGTREDHSTSKYHSFHTRFKDIPVIGNATYSPKDPWVFAASFLDLVKIYRTFVDLQNEHAYEIKTGQRINSWENYVGVALKFVATVGKMALIALGNTSFGKTNKYVYLNLVTQSSGLIKYIIDDFVKGEQFINDVNTGAIKRTKDAIRNRAEHANVDRNYPVTAAA